ncbi:hypothetical protein Tco_0216914 [Tanacetum coccineum]
MIVGSLVNLAPSSSLGPPISRQEAIADLQQMQTVHVVVRPLRTTEVGSRASVLPLEVPLDETEASRMDDRRSKKKEMEESTFTWGDLWICKNTFAILFTVKYCPKIKIIGIEKGSSECRRVMGKVVWQGGCRS